MSFRTYNFNISRGLGFDISTRSFASETFMLQLPWNWYSDFSGFLICVAHSENPDVVIIIKKEMHIDLKSCLLDEFGGTELREVGGTNIRDMCYIPFSSLMHKSLGDGVISFFMYSCTFKVELVPRRSKGGSTERSIDCSEYWDEQIKDRKTFTIEHASHSSIEITWLH